MNSAYQPPSHWRSVPWCSRFFGKSERLIRMWIYDGTFKDAHIPFYKDRRGRVWLCIPEEGTLTPRSR